MIRATSYNRAYLASAIAYAQISLQETSNTLVALSEIEIKIEITYAFSNRIPVWGPGRSV